MKKIRTPKSMREVDRIFSEIAKVQKEQKCRIGRYNRQLEETKKQTERIVHALDKKITHRFINIFHYYLQHWKQLTENGKKKIITLLSGNKLGAYQVQSGVKITNLKRAIKALEAHGLQDFIRKEINKQAILRKPELIFGIRDISIGKKKMFKVVPKETGIAVTQKLSKLKKTI